MGSSNDRTLFNKLMTQLEKLNDLTNNYPNKNQEINILKNDINISLTCCGKKLKEILQSQSYTPNSLFQENEMDIFITKLLEWKRKSPLYAFYFQKAKQLFDDIQKKDSEMTNNNMDIEEQNFNNAECNDSLQKDQKVLSKKEILKVQDLTLLNDNFGRALSSLECLANRYSGKTISKMFDYYNIFNLGNRQDLDELAKKAFVQAKIFKISYEDYIRKYTYYKVPENIDIDKIKELIGNWMYQVPDEQRFIYQGMINIISSLKDTSFEQKFNSYSKRCKNAKLDPKKIATIAPGIYYYNHQRCEEAKNEYYEKEEIISKLFINQSYKNDKKAEYLQQQISIADNLYQDKEIYKDLK